MRPRPFLLLLAGIALALMAAGEAEAEREPEWSYTAGDSVISIAISADGEYIAAGGYDNKTYLFDKDSSTPLWSYETGSGVYSVAISANGEYIVAGTGWPGFNVYLFDKDSSTPLWSYTTGDYVYSVAISADGEYIAAGSSDNKVYLFDKDGSTPLWNYTTGNQVFSVAISADGEYIAAGGYDNKTYLFDKDSSTPLWSYTTGYWVSSVAISADGEYIAAGSADDKVYLFGKDSSTPLWSYETGSDVWSVDISADGEFVAAGSDRVYFFDKDSSTPLWNYTTGNVVRSVAISADGKYIAAGSWDKKVYLFNKDNSAPLWSYTTGWYVRSVAISADGEYIAAGGWDSGDKVYLFNNNIRPTATIDSIEPSPAEKGTTVFFNGSGADSDGTIVGYQWESSIDGELSTEEDFSSNNLSLGHHTITFRVQDNDGVWSTVSDVKVETYEQSNSSLTGWRLQDSDNPDNYHDSADYYESGRPTLLEFFQTECGHCNNQVPTMKDIHTDYIGRIDLLSIGGYQFGSNVDNLADLRDFKSEHQAYWPHLYDSSGELMSDYGFSSYPSFALVVDGQIVWSGSGVISYDGLAAVLDDYIDSGSWNAYSLWIYAVPVAIAGQDSTGTPGVPLQFSGAGTDEDGTIAKYEWDFDGDSVFEWSSTENGLNTYIYNNEGTYTAVLRVTDNDGFTATDSRVITVSKAGAGGGGDDGGGGIPAPSLAAAAAAVAVIALRRPRKA